MLVKCIMKENRVTVGKTYTTLRVFNNCYEIVNDKGEVLIYPSCIFQKATPCDIIKG